MAEDSSQSDRAVPPTRYRRLWRALRWGIAAPLCALLAALVGVRLYYDDERLRGMAVAELSERLGAAVELQELELSFLGGIELRGVRVGAMPGFTRDLVRFERFALHWSSAALLLLDVSIEELALEAMTVVIEENEAGSNLDAAVRALAGRAAPTQAAPPSAPAATAAPETPAPPRIALPELPVDLFLERLLVRDIRVEIVRPGQSVAVAGIGAEGSFGLDDDELALELWLGLGSRDPTGAPAQILIEQPGQQIVVDERLGVRLTASGLGDLDLAIDQDGTARADGPRPLPPLRLHGGMALALDLLAQRAVLERCAWKLGERTSFTMRAALHGLLTGLTLRVDELSAEADLSELSSAVGAALPGASTSGRVSLRLTPLSATAGELRQPEQLAATIVLAAEEVGASLPAASATGIDGTMQLTVAEGSGQLELLADIAAAASAGYEARSAHVRMDAKTPLAPWLGGPAADSAVDLDMQLEAARVAGAGTVAKNVSMSLATAAPIPMLRRQPSAPLAARMELRVGHAASAGSTATGLHMRADVRAWDLTGRRSEAKLALELAEATSPMGEESLRVPSVRFDAEVSLDGDDYRIGSMRLSAADFVRASMSGSVLDATSAAPRFERFALALEPLDLARGMALVPANKRPPAQIAGSMRLGLEIDGVVPHRELTAALRPPAVQVGGSSEEWSAAVAAYSTWLDGWSARLARRLPFRARLSLGLSDLTYADERNAVEGLELDGHFGIEAAGPRLEGTLEIARVLRPTLAEGVRVVVDMGIIEDEMRMTFESLAARVERPDLVRPLAGAGVELSVGYRLGGDLMLDKLALLAPDRGAEVSLSGRVTKPLRLVMERGWERAGLPGVEAALRWKMAYASPKLEAITAGGPEMQGGVELAGNVSIEGGVAALVGTFRSTALSYTAGANVVREMSGELPFDIRLAFDERPEATVLRRGLPFAGGTVALLTSGDDIRARPARPVHYDRLRAYRQHAGLTARSIVSGNYELFDFELDGRLQSGMLIADHIAMRVLGGDMAGNLALQLGRHAELVGDMVFKTSKLDASNFKALDLEPGHASELSADFHMGFLFAPDQRDLTLDINLTRIGEEALDRFLQLMDPEKKDEKIQDYRDYLGLGVIDINGMAMWVRYENLNFDLDYDMIIPAWRPLPREVKRRFALGDFLDVYVQPLVDRWCAPLLGWSHAS